MAEFEKTSAQGDMAMQDGMTAQNDMPTPDAGGEFPQLDAYRESLSSLRLSAGEKDRLVAALADAAAETAAAEAAEDGSAGATKDAEVVAFEPVARKRRWRPLAAAVATLAFLLAVGGVAHASGVLVSVERFVGHLFGGAPATTEVVDAIGRPVGASASSGGVTVTADAVIGDASNVAVIFSISRDDGEPLGEFPTVGDGLLPLSFSEMLDVDFPIGMSWGSTGSSYFFDDDPTDNSIQLVETRSYDFGDGPSASLVGRTMSAHFSDLTFFGDDGSATVVAPGTWDLSFELNYEDSSVALPAGSHFDLNGIDATIESLTISPIALNVSYTADIEVEWISQESGRQSAEDSALADRLLTLGTVTVTMDDGTTVEVQSMGGGRIDDGETADCETSIFFDRIIDVDHVESVTIGETTIEMQ